MRYSVGITIASAIALATPITIANGNVIEIAIAITIALANAIAFVISVAIATGAERSATVQNVPWCLYIGPNLLKVVRCVP